MSYDVSFYMFGTDTLVCPPRDHTRGLPTTDAERRDPTTESETRETREPRLSPHGAIRPQPGVNTLQTLLYVEPRSRSRGPNARPWMRDVFRAVYT